MEFFIYDIQDNEVKINQEEILLIREFAQLWTNERNKTKIDKEGRLKTKAYKEITYIYLMLDWKSPYFQFSEYDRHTESLKDSGLTEDEFNDPLFREACRKYKEIQDSSRIGRLLKSQYSLVDRMIDYFDNLDLNERDPQTGKPIFKFKDVQIEIANTAKMLEGIAALESAYKKEQLQDSGLRGDAEPGAFD